MSRSTDKFHRQDFKIPIDLYQRLQEIAVKHFSAKIHHRSNKPEITSTLIYLLQLGIESLEGSDEPKKLVNRFINSDKGKPITFEQCQAMIDNAISQLRLELITVNTDSLTDNITDTTEGVKLSDRPEKLDSTDKKKPIVNTDIEVSEFADNDTNIKPIVNTDKKTQDNSPVDTDNITEVADKSKENTDNITEVADESTENTDTNDEVLPYTEAVEVIKRLHQEGLSYTKIASQLRSKYYTKRGGSTNWQGIQVKRELVKK